MTFEKVGVIFWHNHKINIWFTVIWTEIDLFIYVFIYVGIVYDPTKDFLIQKSQPQKGIWENVNVLLFLDVRPILQSVSHT